MESLSKLCFEKSNTSATTLQDAPLLYFGFRPAYRWHVNEATPGEFTRRRMPLQFTSVFTPVDLKKPDFVKFPKARAATLYKCKVETGRDAQPGL